MDYDNLDVEKMVDEVVRAEAEGRTRHATKKETMIVRLAALSAMVRQMQAVVENDKELAGI